MPDSLENEMIHFHHRTGSVYVALTANVSVNAGYWNTPAPRLSQARIQFLHFLNNLPGEESRQSDLTKERIST
jgi:hypothetical protein